MEKRKELSDSMTKPTPLPKDYLSIVEEALHSTFDAGLQRVIAKTKEARFYASGAVFGDEIRLTGSLLYGKDSLNATSIHASIDFDPATGSETVDTRLASCIDAIGDWLEHYLQNEDEEIFESFINMSLGSMEDGPFDWTESKEGKTPRAWIKIDKLNPVLETLADEWLEKHDGAQTAGLKTDAPAEEFLEERIEILRTRGPLH
jgi:hypothetical protein